jgi:hypothetical protein
VVPEGFSLHEEKMNVVQAWEQEGQHGWWTAGENGLEKLGPRMYLGNNPQRLGSYPASLFFRKPEVTTYPWWQW